MAVRVSHHTTPRSGSRASLTAAILVATFLFGSVTHTCLAADPDYGDALNKLILFFEGQRSGTLNLATLRNTWRSHSALQDGAAQKVRVTLKSLVATETLYPRLSRV